MTTDNDQTVESYEDLVEVLLEQLSQLSPRLRKRLEKELGDFLSLVLDRRPPRFLLIGRRGVGKSTLINAIFGAEVRSVGDIEAQTGQAVWLEYEHHGKTLEVLDTRGLQEGSAPAEEDRAASSVESILQAVRARCPDVILFLVKATDVDVAIHGDLDALEKIHRKIKIVHKRQLPIVGIVTQCDGVAPPYIRELPTDDKKKNENIEKAVDVLGKHLRSRDYIREHFLDVVPTVGYAEFLDDGTVKGDLRWNIDHLVNLLLDELPQEAKIDFARLAGIREGQKKIAKRVVNSCATMCGIIGTVSLPFTDLPVLTSLQVTMILTISYISGRQLSVESAREFLAALGVNVGAAFVLREVARGLLRLFPGLGSVASGAVAFEGTRTIGRAAIAYFIDKRPIKMKSTFDGEQLSKPGMTAAPSAEPPPREREAMADALLQELDVIAESIEGEFDSAEDIRQIREERADRL